MAGSSNKTAADRRTSTNDAHDRGPGLPSSLESFHHVDHEGNVVHSRAQKSALENAEKIRQRHATEDKSKAKETPPAWAIEPHVRADVAETIPPPKPIEEPAAAEIEVSQGELDEEP